MSYYRHWNNDYAHRRYSQGYHYLKIRSPSGVCNYFTKEFLHSYFEWARDNEDRGSWNDKSKRKGDDVAVTSYLQETKKFFWLTLPNLANHQQVESTLNHPWNLKKSKKEGFMGSTTRATNLFGKKFQRTEWDSSKVAMDNYFMS
jgi:hypothetical protein